MSRRRLGPGIAFVVLALAALAIVATSSAARQAKTAPIKAAWIYVGPHNDGGWSQAHDRGRLYVQKKLGANVITTFKENVPEGPQVAQVIDSLVRDGNKIIFATSFGFQDAMAAAAKKYPDVYFEQATGFKTSKNLAEYFGAGEDSIYLSGIAAGAATKNGVIGYVVPFPIPEVIRHANAFALGAQLTRPGAKIKLVWTKSWFDPAKEKKAAESLVAAGADVIGQNVDSPAAGQYAQSKGIPWVGYDNNARKFAPTSWLTAAVYDWGPYYLKRVKAAANGTWKTGSYYGNMADGFTGLAPYGPKVSAKTKALIAKKKAEIVSGTFYEFQGPLYDQSGKLRVPKGKRMTLPQILSMNWLVKGIEGSPKG
ncbi:putative ABC-type transport system periplasmic component/surface lipoprotein [Gaiella occulta]|uniref:Putative ABC-type transport system periplasmic component/surface lipoprotein n=1 Tax=Gaiella occulta TaxID=1002870 RepID=A0A7M2YU29_9ACTN|nr:BMP family ABC transporter substrate-binding protein [Gaiella occulta]RDI73250.1 putative ABC-type transport system periplasmic component/surface lipoprotein [Gaiella occulta]